MSVVSSGGIMPIETRSSVLSMLRCECDSINPGISVAVPPPSMTWKFSRGNSGWPRRTFAMRFPSTRTSPGYGAAPVQSRTFTCVNSVPGMMEALSGHAGPGGRPAIDSTNEITTLARAWARVQSMRHFSIGLNQRVSFGRAPTVWRRWLQRLPRQRGLDALVEGLLQNGPAGGFERSRFECQQCLCWFGGFPRTRHSGEERSTRFAGDALPDFDREFVQQFQQ